MHRYGKVLGEAGNGVSKNISHNVIKKRRSEAVKRIDRIRTMTTEEIAKEIIKLNITDEYCKGDCEDVWGAEEVRCKENLELECCIRWLEEGV